VAKGKHRGWFVKGTGSESVGFGSRSSARNVARQVKGGKVNGPGCALLLVAPVLGVVFTGYELVSGILGGS